MRDSASTRMVWDAFKTYIRGVIILARAYGDKECITTREVMLKSLEDLDKLHKRMKRIKHYEEYQQISKLLKTMNAKSIAKGLMYGRQKCFLSIKNILSFKSTCGKSGYE